MIKVRFSPPPLDVGVVSSERARGGRGCERDGVVVEVGSVGLISVSTACEAGSSAAVLLVAPVDVSLNDISVAVRLVSNDALAGGVVA